MSATYSRREMLRDALMAELTGISKANGYRTDPKEVTRSLLFPDECQAHPTIIVILGDEPTQQLDMNRTVFTSQIPVVVLGYFSGESESQNFEGGGTVGELEGEALFHDLKRCVASFILKNVNSATNPWHVMGKDLRCFAPVLDRKSKKGECRVEFDVQMQSLSVDF